MSFLLSLSSIIQRGLDHHASDIHLSSQRHLMLRIDGRLVHFDDVYFDPDALESQLFFTMDEEQRAECQKNRQIDYAIVHENGQRLRVNAFYQQRGISAVFRPIPEKVPTLADLNAPAVLSKLIEKENGLILVTGATGSGKSTTLAAMIRAVSEQKRHVITLEDPIEFVHHSQTSLIQQRELGRDVHHFDDALHAALRQDPDIILLGELRSPKTIQLALTAAETGHLVLSTLHTRSAIQSVDRLIDVFAQEEKAFVRAQLAQSLVAVIAQQLLPKKVSGRIAAYEILINTPAIANLIREGKNHQILSLLQTGHSYGMQTMEKGISLIQSKLK